MLIPITTKKCYNAVYGAKKKFLSSSAPRDYKKICENINPIIHLINQNINICAEAWCVKTTKECGIINRLSTKYDSLPISLINGKPYYTIVTFNEFMLYNISRYKLHQLAGHEVGHLIQISIFNEVKYGYSYSCGEELDHDELWQSLSKWCGGNTDSRFEL